MKQAYIVMETKLTRRRAPLFLFSCALWLWSATVMKGQTPSPVILEKLAVYPSVILYNGKIATMDKNLTFHQAMAIRGERIWTLGTNAEIRPLAGPSTEMVDLKGRTVVPELIDANTHPPSLGHAPSWRQIRLATGPHFYRCEKFGGSEKQDERGN